jgi:hypothetical protein
MAAFLPEIFQRTDIRTFKSPVNLRRHLGWRKPLQNRLYGEAVKLMGFAALWPSYGAIACPARSQ